jgi:hypothetical protein
LFVRIESKMEFVILNILYMLFLVVYHCWKWSIASEELVTESFFNRQTFLEPFILNLCSLNISKSITHFLKWRIRLNRPATEKPFVELTCEKHFVSIKYPNIILYYIFILYM